MCNVRVGVLFSNKGNGCMRVDLGFCCFVFEFMKKNECKFWI